MSDRPEKREWTIHRCIKGLPGSVNGPYVYDEPTRVVNADYCEQLEAALREAFGVLNDPAIPDKAARTRARSKLRAYLSPQQTPKQEGE